jgi:long-chain acyl-CoA synthetase
MKFASFLASHAARMGAKDAVVCQGQRLSFRELEDTSNRMAHALRAAGVQVGDRVAIYLPNGIEFVCAFIASIKAGALAVPLNLPLSAPEIAHILADCKPRAVFIDETTQTVYARAAEGLPALLRIAVGSGCRGDTSLSAMVAYGEAAPLDTPFDADACMVAYTSGTTGRAKGVVLTQSNYAFVNGYLNGVYWGLGADDRQICTTPLAHRTGMARLMNMVLHGSTLVVMPRFDAKEAARLVRDERITVFGMVPTVGRMMLPEVEARPQDFASVKVMLVTGEAFPLDVKERLHAALPNVRFYSFYAMTEAGAITQLDASEQFTHATSVGRPWPGVDVKLVDAAAAAVPVGEVGEIWVRSGMPGYFSTMREYYMRPEATAETLRDGWVATGDVGRFDTDGYLYLMDRKKDMVLSGGYNIYSKEVELALQSHPAVADVAVIGVPDATYGEAVAAYVELQPGAAPDANALIAHCRELIASYKKPKHVIFVKSLPRNSTGKVLKVELRERFAADAEPAH